MTDYEKWYDATGEFMRNARPDLYDSTDEAVEDLQSAVDRLIENDGNSFTSFASFILVKAVDKGVVEWTLTLKASTYAVFPEEGTSYTVSHVDTLDLPGVDDL